MSGVGGPFPIEAIRSGTPWLQGRGAQCDVVISSRVRLARNLADKPFTNRATPPQRLGVLEACRAALVGSAGGLGPRFVWANVHELPPIERTLLVERHLISKEHAKGIVRAAAGGGSSAPSAAGSTGTAVAPGAGEGAMAPTPGVGTMPRGVAISLPDEALSVMVNEEDHLRMQAVLPGLALAEAWGLINQLDDRLEGALDFAFSTRFGYLTACPTNVGTGVRMSVMLHLPALRLTGEIERVRRAAKDMSLAVRGFYGEGSESIGDLYQISNQTTLGQSEAEILGDLDQQIIPQVLDYERAARAMLLERKRVLLEDQVFRALGTLRGARLLAPEEALALLSLVRLGTMTGLLPELNDATVNPLIVLTQPAHLQRLVGRELDQQQRRQARAELVRTRLRAGA